VTSRLSTAFKAGVLGLFASVLAAAATAQGVQYRERWSYLQLEQRRAEVSRELVGRDAATRAKVAELLAEDDGGVPFRPVARALAYLRGVPCDDAFLLRATLGCYLLPEVVDPVGDNEDCRNANVTLALPFALPLPADLDFVVEVLDAAGAVVNSGEIVEEVPLADLRMGHKSLAVPCAELPDGRYDVRLTIRVDGKEPAASAPSVRWTFYVQRGFQAHATAAMQRARAAVDAAGGTTRGVLAGFSRQVARAFAGEPFDGGSRALEELANLDRVLDNHEQGRPLLDGLRGDVAMALPADDGRAIGGLGCVLRLPRQDAEPTAPLVVVVAGSPAYDVRGRRPTSPVSRGPAWTAVEMAELGRDGAWPVAFLESPGGDGKFSADLRAGLRALPSLLGGAERPLVLVCEREAASVVALQFANLGVTARALVCIGGGAMPGNFLQRLGPTMLRYQAIVGHPAMGSLANTIAYARESADDRGRIDCGWLDETPLPWSSALAGSVPALERFLRELAAPK
jgi:hypothetical protein